MSQAPERIKCWVAVCEEYPGGLVFDDRETALQSTHECRLNYCKAYVRARGFTQQELDELPEAD